MRREIAKLVSAFGFAAETFDSVAVFLKSAAASRAACLVIDIQLGGASGVELAHQLAAGGCKCPIVFTTAIDDERSRSEAAAAGGIACLRKPIRADALIEIIIKAVG